ncbi:MAG: LysM peptidoglycan-binding domain-containing protein [Firmicutes bacterium]|nr:LysM peptidoglycan-binding domain-containing protein [Bacillota bacterium]
MKNTRKRTRVKSRPRFITFLIIMIGLIVGTFGFVTGMDESIASVTTDYTTYTVCAGDTLWDIADRVNYHNTDTRKIVHVISQTNGIRPDELQPGMVLSIPTDL